MVNAAGVDNSKARSDAFWASLRVNGLEAEYYSDLRGMATAADQVVVARIAGLTMGREVRDYDAEAAGFDREGTSVYFAHAVLKVEQGLSTRAAPAGAQLTLQILLPNPGVLDDVRNRLPTERAIFFLRDMEGKFRAAGFHALANDLDGVFDLVSTQGLLREFEGVVRPPIDAVDPFLLKLDGTAWSTVTEDIVKSTRER
jgi:hypothetical protein